MKMRILLATIVLCAGTVFAAPVTTPIADTVYNNDGTPFTGQLILANNAFISPDGYQIPSNQTTYNIQNGVLQINVVPNVNAFPMTTNQYYVATLMTNPVTTEYWMVPNSTTALAIAQIMIYPPLPTLPATPAPLNIAQGGTGATTVAQAMTNLLAGGATTTILTATQSVTTPTAQFYGTNPFIGFAATSGGTNTAGITGSNNVFAFGNGTAGDASGALDAATVDATQSVTTPSLNHVIYASSLLPIASACSSLSGAQGTVMVTDAQTISATTILPANCGLQVLNGASITVASGQYLQIAGPFQAGLYQTFYGPGSVYFYGGNGTKEVLPQWFGAMGNAKAAGFTATAGNDVLTTVGSNPWAIGDTVTLTGAGVSGAAYTTSVTAVGSGTVTVSTAPSTTVTNEPIYTEDDSAALNAWASSVRGNASQNPATMYVMSGTLGPSLLYMPKGQYTACTAPVVVYSGTVLTFEASNTTQSAVLIQCNPNITALQMNPNNYAPNGTSLNTGNGNNTLNFVNIRGGYQIGSTDTPAIQFLNASNVVSDTRIHHLMCESITGSCVVIGFQTTTTAALAVGATSIPVANGATLLNGMSIVLVGAGTSGANLTTQITAGGGTNTLTVATAVGTAVATGATVWPAKDSYGLWIDGAEIDGSAGGRFLEANGNASGSVWVDNSELYDPTSGAAVSTSNSPISLRWTNNKCYACGTYNSGIAHTSYAIDWEDESLSKQADVTIDNSSFNPNTQGASGTGGIEVAGARNFQMTNSQLWYVDGSTPYKGIVSHANNYVDMEGNTLLTNLATNSTGSTLIELCCSGSDAAINATVKNNVLQNVNTTSAIGTGINLDVAPLHGYFLNNAILGNITNPSYGILDARLDYDGTTVSQEQAAAPTSGTWQVGDVIWNSAPALGSPRGWVNTVAGTPGTWEPFGGVGYTFPTMQVQSEAGVDNLAVFGQITTANAKQLVVANSPSTNTISLQAVQQGVGYNQTLALNPNGGPVTVGGPFTATTSVKTPLLTGQVSGSSTIASSATPALSATAPVNYNVLTANVTSWTLGNGTVDGQQTIIEFCQNATGGFTVAGGPTTVRGFMTIPASEAANKCNVQTFAWSVGQTAWLATGPGEVNE